MALIERIWNDWVTQGQGLGPPWHKVEVAQIGKPSSVWFHEVPTSAYENELLQRNNVCCGCVLYSGSEGDFDSLRNPKTIIVYDRKCTGIYLYVDESSPFRKKWRLQAGAPRGTFSKPDPRALCTK